MPGDSDIGQLKVIFQALGTPTEEDWPNMKVSHGDIHPNVVIATDTSIGCAVSRHLLATRAYCGTRHDANVSWCPEGCIGLPQEVILPVLLCG